MDLSVEAEVDRIASLSKEKDAPGLAEAALSSAGGIGLRALQALAKLGKPGLSPLHAALASETAVERARAARCLGELRDKTAAKALLACLSDEDAAVRANATEALGRLGDAPKAKAIAPLLEDEADNVRRAAVLALRDLGKGDDRFDALLVDDSAALRRAAALAVAASGAAPYVERLAGRLGDGDEGVRAAAADAMAGQHAEELLEPLRAALDDDSEAVRLAAARALAAHEGAEPLLPNLLENRSVYVRRVGVAAVAQRKALSAVEPLMRVARDGPERVVRIEAAQALGALGDSKAVGRLTHALIEDDLELQAAAETALRAILGKDADPDVLRANGHIALEHWDRLPEFGKLALEPLLRALGNRTANPRNVAARCGSASALGALGHAEAVRPLLEALAEPAPQLRAAAAAALGEIGDPACAAGLVAAASDRSEDVRAAAVRALGHLGSHDVVDALTQAMRDAESGVRSAALDAALTLGPAAIPVAAVGLTSADPSERQLAIAALESAGTVGAVDLLHEALLDFDGPTREMARTALERVGWYPVGMRLRRVDAGFARWYLCSEWVTGDDDALPDQVDVLVSALDGDDPALRRAAAETLGELHDPRAIEPLRTLLTATDWDLRAVAGCALVALGEPPGDGDEWLAWRVATHDWEAVVAAGEAALPALATEAEHPEVRVRVAVVRAGSRIVAPGVVDLLVRGHMSASDEVRLAASDALRELPEDVLAAGMASLPEDVAERALPRLIATVRGEADNSERLLALHLLALRPEDAATEALRAALEADEAPLHEVAVAALARRGDAEAVELIEARTLYSPDSAVRAAAARALVELVGEDAVPALTALLLSGDSRLDELADGLLSDLLGDRYDRAVLEAARLVDQTRWSELAAYGVKALEPLKAQLANPERNKEASLRRSAAAAALGAAVGSDALDDLVGAAADDDARVRAAACETLGALEDAGGEQALRAALADTDARVRAAAAQALPKLEVEGIAAALAPLLEDEDQDVRVAAIGALVVVGEDAVGTLVTALTSAGSAAEKITALAALGTIGAPGGCDAAVDALGDTEMEVRRAARRSLVDCGWHPIGLRVLRADPGFARWTHRSDWVAPDVTTPQREILEAALVEDDPVRRRIAAETLADVGDRDAIPALEKALADDDDVDVRIVAAQSLVTLGCRPQPTELWAPFWAGAGQWDHCVAQGEPAVPALISMLSEKLPRVRLGATLALTAIGTPAAIEAAAAMANDPDERVARAAREAG